MGLELINPKGPTLIFLSLNIFNNLFIFQTVWYGIKPHEQLPATPHLEVV